MPVLGAVTSWAREKLEAIYLDERANLANNGSTDVATEEACRFCAAACQSAMPRHQLRVGHIFY